MKEFEERKQAHLKLSLRPDVQSTEQAEWDRVRLFHNPLPEMDFSDVTLSTSFEGSSLSTPFFISGMTAGHPGANAINGKLAKACGTRGWLLGVGSQRRELEDLYSLSDGWAKLRKSARDVKLIGNIGASQLSSYGVDGIRRLVESLEPAAFAIHLNALQELIQPEGTPQFKGVLAFLKNWERQFPKTPLILKETGCGFSRRSLKQLKVISSLFAVDVSGAGGTHWGRIEGHRALQKKKTQAHRLSQTFSNWGVSTVQSVVFASEELSGHPAEIWGSGGVKNGLHAAKLIALGAHRVGFAREALFAAEKGAKELEEWMKLMEVELKTALFCLGYRSVTDLRENARKNQDVTYV